MVLAALAGTLVQPEGQPFVGETYRVGKSIWQTKQDKTHLGPRWYPRLLACYGLLELNSLFRVENFTLFSTYLACILRHSSRKVHTTSDWLSRLSRLSRLSLKTVASNLPEAITTAGQSILPWRCHDLYGLGDGRSRWVRTPECWKS